MLHRHMYNIIPSFVELKSHDVPRSLKRETAAVFGISGSAMSGFLIVHILDIFHNVYFCLLFPVIYLVPLSVNHGVLPQWLIDKRKGHTCLPEVCCSYSIAVLI